MGRFAVISASNHITRVFCLAVAIGALFITLPSMASGNCKFETDYAAQLKLLRSHNAVIQETWKTKWNSLKKEYDQKTLSQKKKWDEKHAKGIVGKCLEHSTGDRILLAQFLIAPDHDFKVEVDEFNQLQSFEVMHALRMVATGEMPGTGTMDLDANRTGKRCVIYGKAAKIVENTKAVSACSSHATRLQLLNEIKGHDARKTQKETNKELYHRNLKYFFQHGARPTTIGQGDYIINGHAVDLITCSHGPYNLAHIPDKEYVLISCVDNVLLIKAK